MIRVAVAILVSLALAACWQKDVGRTYYASGSVRTEATVKNNVLDGPAVMYYENGKKMSDAHYRAGMLHGKSTAYYENGTKKAEAEYRDGVLHGTSTSWSPAGQVVSRVGFDEGRVVAEGPANPAK